MHLRQPLARFFSHTAITEGAILARHGAVQIRGGTYGLVESDVEAEDEFESPYHVKMTRQAALISAECECGERNCLHIWATILVAEQAGLLLGSVGSGSPYMAVV